MRNGDTKALMKKLKILIFEDGNTTPKTTVTVPGAMLRVASKLIPGKVARALHDEGIDVNELCDLAADPDVHGTLVEVEEHAENKKIVVVLE